MNNLTNPWNKWMKFDATSNFGELGDGPQLIFDNPGNSKRFFPKLNLNDYDAFVHVRSKFTNE